MSRIWYYPRCQAAVEVLEHIPHDVGELLCFKPSCSSEPHLYPPYLLVFFSTQKTKGIRYKYCPAPHWAPKCI